ncbi:MAG TPA: hypothetical protein VKY92_01125 [Verrucomicrobiae bacterium]|nr:hypothetical protein [Verrucomicrobiae bacterium]
MISFVQLPYRRPESVSRSVELGPRMTALVLALILFFQIGVLAWAFLSNWR